MIHRNVAVATAACLFTVAAMLAGCSNSNAQAPLAPTTTSAAAAAQTSSTTTYLVSGVVLDASSSQPVAGASVQWGGVLDSWAARGAGAVTDQSGRYQMQVTSATSEQDQISMRATKDGYAAYSRLVTLTPGTPTTVDFDLSR